MALLRDSLHFRILFVIDVLLLLIIIVVQGAFLDYILLKQFCDADYWKWCLFVILDVVVICITVKTLVLAYHHFGQKQEDFLDGKKHLNLRFVNISVRYKKGTLPMSYSVWFIYVGNLFSKMTWLMYSSNCITSDLPNKNPQLLQVFLALSAIVFMLLVEGHNWHKKSSENYTFMTDICKRNGLEIFDTVEILDLLFNPGKLSPEVKIALICLTLFNFMLPSLSLYRLSLSNFGEKRTPACLSLKILQNSFHFFFVDLPFFVIRLHVWVIHGALSIFMMKNFFHGVMAIREIYLDTCMWCIERKPSKDNIKEAVNEDIPLNYNENEMVTGKANTSAL